MFIPHIITSILIVLVGGCGMYVFCHKHNDGYLHEMAALASIVLVAIGVTFWVFLGIHLYCMKGGDII